jgi:hypothetical protein
MAERATLLEGLLRAAVSRPLGTQYTRETLTICENGPVTRE